jgi:ATP-dependent Lon protease
LFAQNTQLTEQNNRIAMQFASRPREAALEERMYAIAEELNRERNQRQVDFEDAEKKRNEDIAKLQVFSPSASSHTTS